MQNTTILVVILSALAGLSGCKDKPNVTAIPAVATAAPASTVATVPKSGVVVAPTVNTNVRTYDAILKQVEADKKDPSKNAW